MCVRVRVCVCVCMCVCVCVCWWCVYLEFDGQTMTVPAWLKLDTKPAQHLRTHFAGKHDSSMQAYTHPHTHSTHAQYDDRITLYLLMMSLSVLLRKCPMCSRPFANGGPSCSRNSGDDARDLIHTINATTHTHQQHALNHETTCSVHDFTLPEYDTTLQSC